MERKKMKQCTEASHLSLSSSTELRRKNSSAHWPEKEQFIYGISQQIQTHSNTPAWLYLTVIVQVFVGSPWYWWKACDVNYAVYMSRARCKQIFVRPSDDCLHCSHFFGGEPVKQWEKLCWSDKTGILTSQVCKTLSSFEHSTKNFKLTIMFNVTLWLRPD